jgi:hypothetical protein
MAGRRTSVYLTEDLASAIDALGAPLPDLLREAVAARTGQRVAAPVRPRRDVSDCDHPQGRRLKGLCNACGTHVG